MRRKDRPVPFPWGSEAWRTEYRRLIELGHFPEFARESIRFCNFAWSLKRAPGEKCLAKTRNGTPCQAPTLMNGRCKLHGGKSTGPKTPEGKAKALSKLRPRRARTRVMDCNSG